MTDTKYKKAGFNSFTRPITKGHFDFETAFEEAKKRAAEEDLCVLMIHSGEAANRKWQGWSRRKRKGFTVPKSPVLRTTGGFSPPQEMRERGGMILSNDDTVLSDDGRRYLFPIIWEGGANE